jgi:dUTP pyrophosphatase
MQVKIKLVDGGIMPERKTKGAAAFDCYAREEKMVIAPCVIPLGFKMEIPVGYHAEIYPRSSIGLNSLLRMANSVGVIDSDFRGEVGFIGESQNGSIVKIEKGQRIAQLIIKKNEDVEFVEVDKLSETERGEGGYGSSGKF